MKPATGTARICITGMGMFTSLGFDIANSCAAARAGLTRLNELKVLNFVGGALWGGQRVMGHTVPAISQGFVGFAKALLLGHCALKDLLDRRQIPSDELDRTGIHVNLSDQFFLDAHAVSERETLQEIAKASGADQDPEAETGESESWVIPSASWKQQCEGFIPRLLKKCKISMPPVNGRTYFGGHTGIVTAIQDATRKIKSGIIDRCIVGGIDCCIEPRFLVAVAANGVLKTSINPIGFIPGEAAGFFLLEKQEEAQSRDVEVACLLGDYAIDADMSNRLSDDPPKGIVLARTIDSVLSKLTNPMQEICLIIGDLNGDNYRAMDWGYALVRLQNKYKLGELPFCLPAAAYGETGAATGALAICTGARGCQRTYAPDGAILVWLAADSGSKAAVCLEPLQT